MQLISRKIKTATNTKFVENVTDKKLLNMENTTAEKKTQQFLESPQCVRNWRNEKKSIKDGKGIRQNENGNLLQV